MQTADILSIYRQEKERSWSLYIVLFVLSSANRQQGSWQGSSRVIQAKRE